MHDLLSEGGLISFHRFQIFVWTLVLGIIFIVSVYNELAMPQFSATLLGLLGRQGAACSAASRLRRQLFWVAGAPRNPKKPVFDFRAHFCHSAPMETHAFGFRLRANAPEDQKRFPIRRFPISPKAISYQ